MTKINCRISEVELLEDDLLLIDIEAEKSFELSDFME
jgi:hypothetical protein